MNKLFLFGQHVNCIKTIFALCCAFPLNTCVNKAAFNNYRNIRNTIVNSISLTHFNIAFITSPPMHAAWDLSVSLHYNKVLWVTAVRIYVPFDVLVKCREFGSSRGSVPETCSGSMWWAWQWSMSGWLKSGLSGVVFKALKWFRKLKYLECESLMLHSVKLLWWKTARESWKEDTKWWVLGSSG